MNSNKFLNGSVFFLNDWMYLLGSDSEEGCQPDGLLENNLTGRREGIAHSSNVDFFYIFFIRKL